MYNLIVGFLDGVASGDRLLEHTDGAVRQYVAPSGAVDVTRLASFPTLVMPELQDRQSPQVARVGDVAELALVGRDYRFRFVPNPAVPAIASDRIERASRLLQIDDWEFNRHHWAVKNVDLYRGASGVDPRVGLGAQGLSTSCRDPLRTRPRGGHDAVRRPIRQRLRNAAAGGHRVRDAMSTS